MPWEALWAVDGTAKATSGNPQGVLAAPVGTIAVRSCDGAIYVKRGGGSTAYGWYLLSSDQFLNYQPRFIAGSGQMLTNSNGQSLQCQGVTTIISQLASHSGAATEFSPKRMYLGGYTSGVAGNSFLYNPLTSVDGQPSQRIDSSVANDFCEFDAWWDIGTTPRASSLTGSTDLTTNAMRIWAGGAWGTNTRQQVGGTVSSDTLFTEWPTALAAVNGLFGFAFRWSSAVDGANWRFVTANAPGGVPAQTVTDMLVPIAANTLYRLRVRFVLIAGSRRLPASTTAPKSLSRATWARAQRPRRIRCSRFSRSRPCGKSTQRSSHLSRRNSP
jgi:hypothetical protein